MFVIQRPDGFMLERVDHFFQGTHWTDDVAKAWKCDDREIAERYRQRLADDSGKQPVFCSDCKRSTVREVE